MVKEVSILNEFSNLDRSTNLSRPLKIVKTNISSPKFDKLREELCDRLESQRKMKTKFRDIFYYDYNTNILYEYTVLDDFDNIIRSLCVRKDIGEVYSSPIFAKASETLYRLKRSGYSITKKVVIKEEVSKDVEGLKEQKELSASEIPVSDLEFRIFPFLNEFAISWNEINGENNSGFFRIDKDILESFERDSLKLLKYCYNNSPILYEFYSLNSNVILFNNINSISIIGSDLGFNTIIEVN